MVQFLHGAETQEIDDGIRSITTVKTAIIGFAFESDECLSAEKARLSVGEALLKDDLIFTAKTAGVDGNAINITIKKASEAGAELAITVSGSAITITLGTNADGEAISTVVDVVDAVKASAEVSLLVDVSTSTTSDASVPDLMSKKFLLDGADEPFPVLVPTIIAGSLTQAKGMGTSSEAYKSVKSIMDQTNALVIAVRAPKATAPENLGSNIIQAIDKFADAQSETQYKPRLLIAPRFSHLDTVGKALESMAARLRAFTYLDCDVTATYIEAMKRAKQYGERVEMLWPQVKVMDTDLNAIVPRPMSEFAAGLRCRIDNEKGVHWSMSNQVIYNILGSWQPVQWSLSDKSSVANILNENKVTTLVCDGGYRLWGNRSCSVDNKWTFECVRRTADMINDSIERAHLWAVDRPGTTQYLQDVLGGIKAYMKQLKFEGIIPGGDAWLDKDLNTPETMAQGIYYFDFDFGVYYPAEHLIFRSRLNNGYLEEVIANV